MDIFIYTFVYDEYGFTQKIFKNVCQQRNIYYVTLLFKE